MDDTLVLRARGLTWRVVDGETVVLDLDDSRYFSVNRSGTVLWDLLVVGATRAGLLKALLSAYRVDERQAEADIDAFASALAAHGVLDH
jgi:hypothetical protein